MPESTQLLLLQPFAPIVQPGKAQILVPQHAQRAGFVHKVRYKKVGRNHFLFRVSGVGINFLRLFISLT